MKKEGIQRVDKGRNLKSRDRKEFKEWKMKEFKE